MSDKVPPSTQNAPANRGVFLLKRTTPNIDTMSINRHSVDVMAANKTRDTFLKD